MKKKNCGYCWKLLQGTCSYCDKVISSEENLSPEMKAILAVTSTFS